LSAGAFAAEVDAPELLFAVFGSVCSAETLAVLVITSAAPARTVIVAWLVVPFGTVPKEQVTVPPDSLHPLEADRKETVWGKASVIVTPVAVIESLFVTLRT
jgi:hypothetical protein